MIRHAGSGQAVPVIALAIPVIEAAFGTLLMQAVGLAALPAAGFVATVGAAIALPSVTTATDEELRTTVLGVAETLSKDGFMGRRHVVRVAGLDNRRCSWQAVTTVEWCSVRAPRCCTPAATTAGVLIPPSETHNTPTR